ncbi:hypothetical protein [Catenulispora rubra]|uniref:hypothetical protein n=1 Tax=Catenulispora rubra TaxID=280293 RepID=UPI0018921B52|nr:hypothetical protein [Catenulispora rubra]
MQDFEDLKAQADAQALEALVDPFSGLADALKDTHQGYQNADEHSKAVVTSLAKASGL